MPGRETPLVTDQIYHVVNRGIGEQPIFFSLYDYSRAFETILYYQNVEPPARYSYFIRLPVDQRNQILLSLKKEKNFLVNVLVYCLMPNHFHLLVKQIKDNGISTFVANFSNSYTRYLNTKKSRKGPIFQGKFKAVRIENDEQLLHVSRYIHLNPYTSYLVKTIKEAENYRFSSLGEYLNLREGICQKEAILGHFSKLSYRDFVIDQASYQRELENIKHLTLEV